MARPDFRYSPEPVEFYRGRISNKVLDDLQMWNWRYMEKGDAKNGPVDVALAQHFGDAQRRIMLLPPLEALEWYEGVFQKTDTGMQARMKEAHVRLCSLVTDRYENVLVGNFRRDR
jgi:hypothetical protein